MIEASQLKRWNLLLPERSDQSAVQRALAPLLERRASEHNGVGIHVMPGDVNESNAEEWAQAALPRLPKDDADWASRPFLLIVAPPNEISWELQRVIQRHITTGRLPSLKMEDLSAYAQKVIEHEDGAPMGQDPNAGKADLTLFSAYQGDEETTRRHKALMPGLVTRGTKLQRTATMPLYELEGPDAADEDPFQGLLRRGSSQRRTLMFSNARGLQAPDTGWYPAGEQDRFQGALVLRPELLANNPGFRPGPALEVPPELLYNAELFAANPILQHGLWVMVSRDSAGASATPRYPKILEELGRLDEPLPVADYLPSRTCTTPDNLDEDWLNPLAAQALWSPRGPVALLGHVDETFANTYSREVPPGHSELMPALAEDIIRGMPVGWAMDRLLRAAQVLERALAENRSLEPIARAWRMLVAEDLGQWFLFGDPALSLLHRSMWVTPDSPSRSPVRSSTVSEDPAGPNTPPPETTTVPPETTTTATGTTTATTGTTTAPTATTTPEADPNAGDTPQPTGPLETIRLEISADEVRLSYGDSSFRSPSLLGQNQKLLLAASSAEERGELLFRSVINDQTIAGTAFASTALGWGQLADTERPRRLALDISGSGPLSALPWEEMRPPGERPLSVREELPFFRELGRRTAPKSQPLRILVFIGQHPDLGQPGEFNDLGVLPPVDAALEAKVLRNALKRLEDAGVPVTFLGEKGQVTLRELSEALEANPQGDQFTLVHILCHGLERGPGLGSLNPQEAGYHLIFPRAEDDLRTVPVQVLEETLNKRAQLVILASCQSASGNQGQALGSLGQRMGTRLPAVIAMRGNLPVDAAQAFARHFYDDLARSGDVARALAATRMAMRQNSSLGDSWSLPVLFSSVKSSGLFATEHSEAMAPLSTTPALDLSEEKRQLLMSAWRTTAVRTEPSLGPEVLQELMLLQQALDKNRAQGPRLAQPQDTDSIQKQVRKRARLDPLELRTWLTRNKKLSHKHLFADSVYMRLCAALTAKQHIVLIGPPGTGKSTLAEQVCEFAKDQHLCADYDLCTATADWTTFDTLGGNVPDANGGLQYRPGLVVESIRQARWLIIDEMNRADIDKAIGELFTVLAGQPVVLPYKVDQWPVRLRPPKGKDPEDWLPNKRDPYDYIVHPNWRILGTMNVYDKASLYAMSFAFMRRFAFIEVDVPPADDLIDQLLPQWAAEVPGYQDQPTELAVPLRQLVDEMGALYRHRRLGPAIIKDMVRYVEQRCKSPELPLPNEESPPAIEPVARLQPALIEAVELYALPQLDSLRHDAILEVYQQVRDLFGDASEPLLRRIREMYPALAREDWEEEPERLPRV